MYLNDAFDVEIDRKERPERPIPSGAVDLRSVFAAGIVMFLVGLCLLAWIGFAAAGGTGGWPGLAGLVLVISIVVYDWHHKQNPFSPYLMAVCRMMVYVTAGLCFVVPPPPWLLLAAVLLFSYLIGLTYIAKQENRQKVDSLSPALLFAPPLLYALYMTLAEVGVTIVLALLGLIGVVAFALWMLRRRLPGDIGLADSALIAGICLLDAFFLAGAGETVLAWWAIGAFILTLLLQRVIPGT
jgi:4-hydroxybenzoate polyprenyltransferase